MPKKSKPAAQSSPSAKAKPKEGRTTGNSYGNMLPFYILLALNGIGKYEGQERHPRTSLEINGWLEKNYPAEKMPSRTTIDQILETLCNCPIFLKNPYTRSDPHPFGIYIDKEEKPRPNGTSTKQFILHSDLPEELAVMILDAIEAYAYIDNDDTARMINYMANLFPFTRRKVARDNPQKASAKLENNYLPENANVCSAIIKKGGFAKIINGHYGLEHDQLALLPSWEEARTVKPVDLLWNNGHYYLLAYMDPGRPPYHLRLDRILFIEALDDLDELDLLKKEYANLPEYSSKSYQAEHPVMFGGDVKDITMLCHIAPRNGVMNALVDTFGFHPHRENRLQIPSVQELIDLLGPHAEEILAEKPQQLFPSTSEDRSNGSEGWIIISYKGTLLGSVLFATEYSKDCKMLRPTEGIEMVRDNLRTAWKLYDDASRNV